MRVAFVIILLVVFSSTVQAGVIGSLGTNLTYEYAADGRTMEYRNPFSLRAGYRFRPVDAYFEYSRFQVNDDGTPMVGVWREHQEFIFWMRRLQPINPRVSPYGAIGTGYQIDRVETRFAHESAGASDVPQPLVAIAAGLRFVINKSFDLQIEARAAASPTYSPNPLLGLGAALGIAFD